MARKYIIIPTLSAHPLVKNRRKLYNHLVELADRGELCPRNDALAAATGYARNTIAAALSDLTQEGLISLERRGFDRRVTIAASGHKTAEPEAWSQAPAPFIPKRPVREIAAKAIELSGRPRRDVLSRSRFREHIRVRQVICSFAIREGWGPSHAARVIGIDHTTVSHSCKVLPLHAEKEPETAALIAAMARELPPLPERCAA